MATTKRRNRHHQIPKGPHGGMQLVLTEDVPHLGKQGDVVEVKPGYGRNYLVPRGMATVPTPHNLRLLERYKIPGIIIEANANDEGHLYGSVGAAEISKALKAKTLHIDPEMVRMEGGVIKEVGRWEVVLNLGYEIETKLIVAVVNAQEKK
jgi:large subunit ribosomal protein L9